MSDDIVTRLRGEFLVRWVTSDELPILGEAADEIERLRNKKHNSLVLGPNDTLIIHVPIDTPKDVCEDMAQNVPDHLKGRIVVVRSVEVRAVRFGAE